MPVPSQRTRRQVKLDQVDKTLADPNLTYAEREHYESLREAIRLGKA